MKSTMNAMHFREFLSRSQQDFLHGFQKSPRLVVKRVISEVKLSNLYRLIQDSREHTSIIKCRVLVLIIK